MAFHRAYYRVIQFCPDRGRAEAANIGVILLCPELGFARARMSETNERVSRFFGPDSFDDERLRVIKKGIEAEVSEKIDWSEGSKVLEQYVGRRANEIQLTHPRPTKTPDPESELEILFRELV